MISKFFIDRPIFASVLSILIFIIGLASIVSLPIAHFPEITPPTVQISAVYPGANAETVAESLAAPIEQELSGANNLLYFQSYSSNDGSLRVTATFEIGSNIDLNAVEVQNRMKRAEPRLPQEAIRQGITVTKSSTNMLLVAAVKSTNPHHDNLFLSNYATINMLDTIRRVPGIGDATVFGGADYSMRIWINPDLLSSKGLTITDVSEAIREQNGLYAAGRIGAAPTDEPVELTIPVVTKGRLQSPEDFKKIILRANPDGTFLYLEDVARVELSSQSFDLIGRQDGVPTTFILTYLKPGGNALQTARDVISTLDQLKANFPEGMRYEVPYDTTPFIRIAIEEVAKTFGEAIGLVTLVVLLFLGTWRATLIPLLAVPVAIIGTFSGMLLLGFSINSLTLFGLVLAIGIVVDDAILVVENVERIMHEEHLPVREATIRAMEQVSGPIIAIVLVLCSVFLPVGFLGGLTGELYRQFAVTIAISVFISGVVALTLSPALCTLLLKPQQKKMFIFRWFDSAFEWFTRGYSKAIREMIRFGIVTMCIFGVMLYMTWHLFQKRPSGFIPQEDQGYLIVAVSLPPGASMSRTLEVVKDVEDFMKAQPEVRNVVALVGMDLLAGFSPSTNGAVMFVPLKPWDQRPGPQHHVDAIVGRAFAKFGGMKEGFALFINPPPVQGLGFRSGFEYQLENRAGDSPAGLAAQTNKLIGAISAMEADGKTPKHPQISRPNGIFNVALPQLYVDLDLERTKLRGVPVNTVYTTLQALLGSLYINDFVKFGRIYRVQIQADAPYRKSADVIGKLYVKNVRGEMVPVSELVTTRMQAGPNVISRFNGFPSVQITGETGQGYSSGEAIKVMEEISKKTLDPGYAFEWSGSSYQEIRAGKQAPYIIAFGLLIVFLVLCGLYERWSLPVAVMLGIPSGAFGAILAITLRGIPKDIYFQVGLLTLIGLAAKNAILIVEYSAVLKESGMATVEAAVEAARVRLRPFIMTSMAFVLGVTPLVIAEGAGAAGRHSIGTGVIGGMIAATFLDMFFVPLFFVIVQWLSETRSRWRKMRGLPPIEHHHGRKHTPIHGPVHEAEHSGDGHMIPEDNGSMVAPMPPELKPTK